MKLPSNSEPSVAPRILHDEQAAPGIAIDAQKVADIMRELGIPDQAIADTTIYIDPKSRLNTYGAHYPNRVGRLRLRSVDGIEDSSGDIIRLSTVIKGKERPVDATNRTLVHELEHRAQQERKDPKITQGHIALYGLILAGAVLGNRLGKGKISRAAGTVVGAGIGFGLGDTLAPHERQARARARAVKSSAISKT